MNELDLVNSKIFEYGYFAETIQPTSVNLFEGDLDLADKYDLGRTWRNDWRKELEATLSLTELGFVISSHDHGGSIVLGVTPNDSDTAQIWLLQSASFKDLAFATHGRAWPVRFNSMTISIINIFLARYPTLFNFIASRQNQNIRWLKQTGFNFFKHPQSGSDMLFFAIGEKKDSLAVDSKFWMSFLGRESEELS